ncbi:MAG: sulfate adenylyltransferase [Deltaproteobacteria bacterium]|nr:sulfate adenylyltransferase [Deltaproteobacteria bacterium]
MIKPHGSSTLNALYINDAYKRQHLENEAKNLPSIIINSAAAANAVMLGAGYFNPLTGYMGLSDAISIADNMHTNDGLFWPIPIINMIEDASAIKNAKRLALRDPNVESNPVIAVMDIAAIETISEAQMQHMTQKIFGTYDANHPGVKAFTSSGRTLLSGPIQVLNFSYFSKEFPETFRTAKQLREEIAKRGWQKTVAFQTRNPMHRAHEELCRMALTELKADGILIHMLLGHLKAGDIPATVRDASIRKMVELYFPKDTVLIAGYGFDMMYAGPREAVLHAVFRQNAGCTHLIVGRDHAGVGSFYGPFDAQTIFDHEVPEGALEIKIFKADHTAWSKKLGRVVMLRDASDHKPEDFIMLSGTKVRELLSQGQALPPEFSRPEVAAILRDYYQAT